MAEDLQTQWLGSHLRLRGGCSHWAQGAGRAGSPPGASGHSGSWPFPVSRASSLLQLRAFSASPQPPVSMAWPPSDKDLDRSSRFSQTVPDNLPSELPNLSFSHTLCRVREHVTGLRVRAGALSGGTPSSACASRGRSLLSTLHNLLEKASLLSGSREYTVSCLQSWKEDVQNPQVLNLAHSWDKRALKTLLMKLLSLAAAQQGGLRSPDPAVLILGKTSLLLLQDRGRGGQWSGAGGRPGRMLTRGGTMGAGVPHTPGLDWAAVKGPERHKALLRDEAPPRAMQQGTDEGAAQETQQETPGTPPRGLKQTGGSKQVRGGHRSCWKLPEREHI